MENLKEKVFQALGAASVCWLPNTGMERDKKSYK